MPVARKEGDPAGQQRGRRPEPTKKKPALVGLVTSSGMQGYNRQVRPMRGRFVVKAIVLALALVASGVLAALLLYPRFKRIEKRGPAASVVIITIPQRPEEVGATLSEAFRGGARIFQSSGGSGRQWYRFRLARFGDPIFPDDFQLKAWSREDPQLRRYVELPPSLKKDDLYLFEPSGDYYWPSEYFYEGEPAKFRSSFILHLERQASGETKLEIIEYLPEIWVGEEFGWSAHAGPIPGFFHDIRIVAPTTADRKEVVKKIEEALAETPGAAPGH